MGISLPRLGLTYKVLVSSGGKFVRFLLYNLVPGAISTHLRPLIHRGS